jgi:hypothetical protein
MKGMLLFHKREILRCLMHQRFPSAMLAAQVDEENATMTSAAMVLVAQTEGLVHQHASRQADLVCSHGYLVQSRFCIISVIDE